MPLALALIMGTSPLEVAPIAAQVPELEPAQWREDLEVLRDRLTAAHIDLFHLLPERDFHGFLDNLSARTESATAPEMLVGIARVVSAVGEGHTSARILMPQMRAYPVLTQVQEDGVRIRRVPRAQASLLGGRITSVEGHRIEEILNRLGDIISADNATGVRAWIPLYLPAHEVLEGLGLMDSEPGLTVEVETTNGVSERVILEAMPIAEAESVLLGPSGDMASIEDGAPLRVRDRRQENYWYEWLPEEETLFVRIDRLISDTNRPWSAWVKSLMAEIDERNPDRLIMDVRSLSGGNHISLPLIHGLVRRPWITERGKFFVLIGRGTFSAGQNMVTLLDLHVAPIFVGEPTGGRPNHYGVVDRFVLPNSGLEIRYSRYMVQDSDPTDYRHWQAPHISAPPDVLEEAEGGDSAIAAALTFEGPLPGEKAMENVESAFASDGLDGALAAAREHAGTLRAGGWIVEREINSVAYGLLRSGRTEDALTVFRLNVELFPRGWNAWDSLGEALAVAGRREEATAAFQRSLNLNGYNENARRQLRILAVAPTVN